MEFEELTLPLLRILVAIFREKNSAQQELVQNKRKEVFLRPFLI